MINIIQFRLRHEFYASIAISEFDPKRKSSAERCWFHQFVGVAYIVLSQFMETLQFAWRSSEEGLKMKKMNFIVASLVGLTCALLSAHPTKAAPFSGSFTPAIDTGVTSVAQHCCCRPNGRWVSAYRDYDDRRPYDQPYGDCPSYRYGEYRFHYQPYGYFPAYRYRAERPYHSHEFYLPNEYDRPEGLYGGRVFYYGDAW
jgi:hypothetical protein